MLDINVQAIVAKARSRRKRLEINRELPLPDLGIFDDNRIPVAYGYGRVSSAPQYGKCTSVPEQKERAEAYYKLHLEPKDIVWGGFHDDGMGISATKVPFHERPSGRKLIDSLRPGDHIVFDKIDRMWRSVSDFCRMTEWFSRNSITMHIVNMGGMSLNTSSPIGKVVLTMLASLAEAEAAMTATRIRDSINNLRASSKSHNMVPVSGTMFMPGKAKSRILVWDLDMRAKMQETVRLRDEEFYTFEEIAIHFEDKRRVAEGLEPMSPILRKRWINATNRTFWSKPYFVEKAIQILQITEPNQLLSRNDLIAVAKMHDTNTKESRKSARQIKLAGRKSMLDPIPTRS